MSFDTNGRRTSRRPLPFEVLVERHGRALLRFCVARLGAVRGEDAFQETLLAALSRYGQLRDPGAARSWLFSIAHRKVIDTARAELRAPIPSAQVDDTGAVWQDREVDGGIWSEVATLPPKQREAIGLRFLAELSHAEIAAVMGTSEPAARRNVFEGLKQLRTRTHH